MDYNDKHKIFVTSDTHFGHTKTITDFIFRPFSSVEEMDEKMIENWNNVVGNKDTIFHLGDFAFQNPKSYTAKLNGQIHIIPGNHDRVQKLKRANFACIHDQIVLLKFTYEGEKKEVVLCHYPLLSWNKRHYGVPHLFGHIHTGASNRDFDKYNQITPLKGSYDVGVDNNNYTPLDILEAMNLANL